MKSKNTYLIIAILMGVLIIVELITGITQFGTRHTTFHVHRDTDPTGFWIDIGFQFFLEAVFLFLRFARK
jgi:hypothetical protein